MCLTIILKSVFSFSNVLNIKNVKTLFKISTKHTLNYPKNITSDFLTLQVVFQNFKSIF